jgi:DNA-binding NarL/FixJ family response regulator
MNVASPIGLLPDLPRGFILADGSSTGHRAAQIDPYVSEDHMGEHMESAASEPRLKSSTRRVVIVADNSLIVEAIRIGFRKSGEFNLVGHADGRRTSAQTIVGAQPDVILLDDMDRSERALELIRELTAEDETIRVIVLSVHTDPEWLQESFDAGATAVISKSAHPVALATLVRETLDCHIFHRPCTPAGDQGTVSSAAGSDDLPLTGRELEILQLVASGSTNGEVARRLWVTEQTVKFHLRNIYRKLDVANRTQASHFAYVNGLVRSRVAPQPELAVAAS